MIAALAAGFVIHPVWLAFTRSTVAQPTTNVTAPVGLPATAVLEIAGFAFVASMLAFIAWRRYQRTRRASARLAALASRIVMGERGVRIESDDPALEPLAAALNRLGTILKSAETMLLDRDRQLAVIRKHARLGYWETDREGRFRRLEFEPDGWARNALSLLGRPQFDDASPLDRNAWHEALANMAAIRPFHDLLVERSGTAGQGLRVLESGEPRFGADGACLGYCGIVRLLDGIAAPIDAVARTALETSRRPYFVLGPAPWPAPIVWMNQAARQLLDGTDIANPNGAARPSIAALLDPDDADAEQALGQALAGRVPMRRALRVRDRFGDYADVVARLEPLNDGSLRTIVVLDTIEHEFEALRAGASDAESLRKRVRQLEAQVHQGETFAWSVSHDLRAPLRIVDGFTRIVLEDHASQLDPTAYEHLARARTAVARMDQMIDALVGLSRLSSQPLFEIPVDLDRLAGEILDAAARAQPSREVEVHCRTHARVRGDSTLLRVLLQNLLGNAWKYTSKRADARICFESQRDERGRTFFCVADNGAGFDMAHAGRLFGVFQRLHPNDEFPGTGVGLAIAQRIVERHGGIIWAEAAPGEGARFYFTFGENVETVSPAQPVPALDDEGSAGPASVWTV